MERKGGVYKGISVGWSGRWRKPVWGSCGCTVSVLKGENGAKYPVSLSKLHYLYFIPWRLFKQVKASVCITLPGCTLGNITAEMDWSVSPTDQTWVKVSVITKLWAPISLFAGAARVSLPHSRFLRKKTISRWSWYPAVLTILATLNNFILSTVETVFTRKMRALI